MSWIKQTLSHLIGQQAESLACDYLISKGLLLLERNYRCRLGEIDLIMEHEGEIVFVEVKYRKENNYGSAEEYFHPVKRKKFEATLLHYLNNKKLNPSSIPHRIDLLAINGKDVQWYTSV